MKPGFEDVLIIAGMVVLGIGLGMISLALALIVLGGVILLIGLAGAWLRSR